VAIFTLKIKICSLLKCSLIIFIKHIFLKISIPKFNGLPQIDQIHVETYLLERNKYKKSYLFGTLPALHGVFCNL